MRGSGWLVRPLHWVSAAYCPERLLIRRALIDACGHDRQPAGVLHDFITSHRDEIVTLLTQKLRSRAPEREETELLDSLPAFLEEIVRSLRCDAGGAGGPSLQDGSETAVNHGKQRHRLGFQINDAAEGFGMVCDSIAEVAVRHRLNVSARELQLVNLCVDSAVSAAISEYWEASRVEHEQRVTERIGFLVHELRNSLSVASMAYRIVRQGRVGLASQTADAVERSLQRMERLVGEATAAIQLESRARPAREPLHLRSLVEEAQGAVPLGREVSLHFDVPEDLTVLGDASLLGSALANLLQNAGKFSRPAGTVVVRGLQNEIEVVLEIEDECGGLPEGDTSELFRPFSQRSDDKSGLGLGLSIAREAALVHGGRIDVRNLPGKGCVFSLAIPKRS